MSNVLSLKRVPFRITSETRQFLQFDESVGVLDRLEVLTALHAKLDGPFTPAQLVELRVVDDTLHPAFGQYGLFAKIDIPSGVPLMPYSGAVQITESHVSSRNYTMAFCGEDDDLEIDGEFFGSFARFANDPRGTQHQANVRAKSSKTRLGEPYITVESYKAIAAGEEVFLNYGNSHRFDHLADWTDGVRRVTRPRRISPFPCPVSSSVSPKATTTGVIVLKWMCTRCGGWSPLLSSIREICIHCSAPKHVDVPMVGSYYPQPAKPFCESPVLSNTKRQREEHGVRGKSGSAAPWPLSFLHSPWQVWDTLVPRETISKYCSAYESQGVFLAEIQDDAGHCMRLKLCSTSNKSAGAELGAAGGLVVWRDTNNVVNLDVGLVLPLPDVLQHGQRLVLLVTNEFLHAKKAVNRAAANVEFELVRDPMGFVYCSVVAMKDIQSDEELMYSPFAV